MKGLWPHPLKYNGGQIFDKLVQFRKIYGSSNSMPLKSNRSQREIGGFITLPLIDTLLSISYIVQTFDKYIDNHTI